MKPQDKVEHVLAMQSLTFLAMKNVAGTERRAQLSLYLDNAWDVAHVGYVTYSLCFLIEQNHNN